MVVQDTGLKAPLNEVIAHQRAVALHQLVVQAAIALALTIALAAAVGWFASARALRPLRSVTATAHRLSQRNLDERITLRGPRDEIKELADTFDEMLGRLAAAFDAQRRFVANASHELRTPLTRLRALIDDSTGADTTPQAAHPTRCWLLDVAVRRWVTVDVAAARPRLSNQGLLCSCRG